MLASIYIGNIDAAVGAEKAVLSFSDKNAIFAADDGAAFAKGEFDDSGVEVVLFCPGN